MRDTPNNCIATYTVALELALTLDNTPDDNRKQATALVADLIHAAMHHPFASGLRQRAYSTGSPSG